jgi:hypothetical protein
LSCAAETDREAFKRFIRHDVVPAPTGVARAGHQKEGGGIAPICVTHAHIVSGALLDRV